MTNFLSRIPRARIAALILLPAMAVAGCGKKEPPAFERPPAPVVVAAAITKDVPEYLDEVGKCTAVEVVSLQPQVTGQILKVDFVDGADVKVGAPLFTLDPRPFEATLAAANAAKLQAEASLSLANTEYTRVQKLTDARAVSEQEVEARSNAVDVAKAQIKAAEAAVALAKLNLEYATIKSPIKGRAGHRLVDPGNIVKANETALVVIERFDPMYVDFTVTEGDLATVNKAMKDGQLNAEIRLPDDPDHPHTGPLTFIDNTVDEATGTVRLRATLPNADHYLWPRQFVKARLILRTIEKAVLIPVDAPQVSATGPFVYVVKEDSTAELRPVTLGQKQGDLIVATSGLKSGERVVRIGQIATMPGGKVRIVEAPPTQPAGSQPAGGPPATTQPAPPSGKAQGSPEKQS